MQPLLPSFQMVLCRQCISTDWLPAGWSGRYKAYRCKRGNFKDNWWLWFLWIDQILHGRQGMWKYSIL